MDSLRRPFLVGSLVAIALAMLICLGSNLVTGPPPFAQRVDSALSNPDVRAQLEQRDIDPDDARDEISQTKPEDPPGLAIPNLAVVNGLLLLVLILTSLPMLVGDRTTGNLQGLISVIGGLVGLIVSIVLAIVAFVALLLMVTLFLAAPFGTLAYLAIFGSFDSGGAAAITSLVMIIQVAGAVLLVLAQERFLKSKGLMLLLATAILLTFVVALLQGIVPGILVSITDALAALVVAIVAAIWSLVILIGGLVGVIRLLQLGRHGGPGQLSRPSA